MKAPDTALREMVLQWLDKAAADFDAAEQLSTQGGRLREIVAFHCRQAVEKYLKALPVRRQIEFPKTHDIANQTPRFRVSYSDRCEEKGVFERLMDRLRRIVPHGQGRAPAMAPVPR
jgi:HEPN domain-containing protein